MSNICLLDSFGFCFDLSVSCMYSLNENVLFFSLKYYSSIFFTIIFFSKILQVKKGKSYFLISLFKDKRLLLFNMHGN